MFSLICAWINSGVNNHEAGDLICHRIHYDVIIMSRIKPSFHPKQKWFRSMPLYQFIQHWFLQVQWIVLMSYGQNWHVWKKRQNTFGWQDVWICEDRMISKTNIQEVAVLSQWNRGNTLAVPTLNSPIIYWNVIYKCLSLMLGKYDLLCVDSAILVGVCHIIQPVTINHPAVAGVLTQ